jgi:hypothetical protein
MIYFHISIYSLQQKHKCEELLSVQATLRHRLATAILSRPHVNRRHPHCLRMFNTLSLLVYRDWKEIRNSELIGNKYFPLYLVIWYLYWFATALIQPYLGSFSEEADPVHSELLWLEMLSAHAVGVVLFHLEMCASCVLGACLDVGCFFWGAFAKTPEIKYHHPNTPFVCVNLNLSCYVLCTFVYVRCLAPGVVVSLLILLMFKKWTMLVCS